MINSDFYNGTRFVHEFDEYYFTRVESARVELAWVGMGSRLNIS